MTCESVDDGEFIQITRHLSPEEFEKIDKENAEDLRHYRRIIIHKEGIEKLMKYQEEAGTMAERLLNGVPVHYKLLLVNDTYVHMSVDNFCVNIRRYWKPLGSTELKPTRMGVTLKPLEFIRLLGNMQRYICV